MFVRIHVQALCAALVLLGSPPAFAVCIPTHVYEVYVGDTASDSACTYNSIQAALDATYTCPTTVRITREHLWTSQHLSVSNRNLILQGEADGVTCFQMANCIPAGGCHADTTTPLVTLDGNNSQGQSSGRVLDITGNSNITLRDLTIEHGVLDSAGHGGGINFTGSGSLTLDTTSVISNIAGYGSGINVSASGGDATLRLEANTLIALNNAFHDGGGIHLEGSTRMFALESPASIFFNHAANGDGGGLMVVGPARADLAAHTSGGTALVGSNDAAYGGGIAAVSTATQSDPVVRLFTTNPRYPGGVSGNFATQTGGGVYLKDYLDSTGIGDAYLCASDFQIDGNSAQEGSAVYADDDYSSLVGYASPRVAFNNNGRWSECVEPETVESLGAVSCAYGVACNSVSDNTAEDSNNNPTDGSAILIQDNGDFFGGRTAFRGNQGGHVVRGIDTPIVLHNCLIADNAVSAEPLHQTGGNDPSSLDVFNCTLAGNSIAGGSVIYNGSETTLSLTDSIIDQAGVPTLDYNGAPANPTVNYVLSNDTSTLPVSTGVVQGEPTFVDAANGDYHLLSTSLGVDFAPPVSGDDRDLDGLPHDQDLPQVPNAYGDRDLGAYEIPLGPLACGAADTIFCDGFESP